MSSHCMSSLELPIISEIILEWLDFRRGGDDDSIMKLKRFYACIVILAGILLTFLIRNLGLNLKVVIDKCNVIVIVFGYI